METRRAADPGSVGGQRVGTLSEIEIGEMMPRITRVKDGYYWTLDGQWTMSSNSNSANAIWVGRDHVLSMIILLMEGIRGGAAKISRID